MATKILEVTTAIILIAQVIAVPSSADKCELHCVNAMGGGDLCVTADLICDHFPDCDNGEDEAPEMCACRGFTCVSNGFCIEAASRCDGFESCFDKSDEVNCTKEDYKQNFPSLPDEDLCKRPCGRHGSCSFASDGRAVCLCNEGYLGASCEVENIEKITSTQAPEEEEGMFACDRKEISMKFYCDGQFECADKTDEMNCTLEDYEKTKPHLEKRFLCLMPCRRTSCAFDGAGRAHCPCPENSEGVFCESLTRSSTQPLSLPTASAEDAAIVSTSTQSPSKPQESNEEVVVESSNIFTTIVLPIFAIAGLALGLWLWLSKPWTADGSMTRPLV